MLRWPVIVSVLFVLAVGPQEVREEGGLSGRIIRSDSDKPISGVRLALAAFRELTDEGMLLVGQPVVSVTGSDGSFAFSNVAPGQYVVAVGHDGFTRQSYGPVDIESGRELKNVVFRLVPEATLSGRVLSDSGFAEGMQVLLVRHGYDANGRKMFTAVANAQTNDRGEYRLFGFPPGKYLLVARPNDAWNLMNSPFSPGEVRPTYTTTYFPGTVDGSIAEAFEVKSGVEIQKDLLVVRQKSYRVRGRVTGVVMASPGPLRTSGLSIIPVNFIDGTGSTFGISPKSNGTFEFEGVPPGRYFLMGLFPLASRSASGTLPTPPPAQLAVVPIEVAGADLENVIVDFAPLASVQGQFSVEGRLADMPGATAVQVELIRSEGSPRIPALPVRLVRMNNPAAADGSFSYDGIVPGEYNLRFVWEGIEPYAYFDPEFVRRFEDRGVPVRITESSVQTIDVNRL